MPKRNRIGIACFAALLLPSEQSLLAQATRDTRAADSLRYWSSVAIDASGTAQ